VNLARPFQVVTPTLDGDVLAVLAGADKAFSGREVERQVGHASHRGVQKTLARLVNQGIVLVDHVGGAYLYALNRRHLAAPSIEELAGFRLRLIRRMREAVASWEIPPVVAVLFGSAARGDADQYSDLDVLIVRPGRVDVEDDRWRAQLAFFQEEATGWTGNDARALELGEEELTAERLQESVVRDAVAQGILLGGSLDALRGKRARA
jgi:hypothetical protein